jgi:signal transduction histidine kinase
MEELIADLLELVRKGESVDEPEAVDVGSLAETCWGTVTTDDATLIRDIDRHIRADESRLQQLAENLIRNAIAHGGADVTVTIGGLDGGFYVEDDDPGIPEDRRDEVFEEGYSTTDRGTGFGLNIVKQVVDAHGWEIRVTDSDDGRARFEITGVTVA